MRTNSWAGKMSVDKCVKVLATGDVHSPDYLKLYMESIKRINNDIDIILWVGDMVRRGRVEALEPVLRATREKFPNTKIVSIYGNEEYWGLEEVFRKRYQDIIWLDDEYVVINVRDVKVGVVGTRGALERPTRWQRKNKPELWRIYRERPKRIELLLREAKAKADIVILASHYTVGFETAKGEPESILPEMGSRAMMDVVLRTKPDVVFHAHAHNAKVLEVEIGHVKIYNVSIVARKNVWTGNVCRIKRGLEVFFKS